MRKSKKPIEINQTTGSCPICGNKNRLFKFEAMDIEQRCVSGSFRYYQCECCGVVSIFPMPTIEAISSFYDGNYQIHHKPVESVKRGAIKLFIYNVFRESVQNKIIRKVINDIKKNKSTPIIVEYGCGNGSLLNIIQKEMLCNVIGYDFSERAVEAARSYKLNSNLACNLASINETNIDFLMAFQLLEHMQDPKEFIQVASSKLSQNGYLTLALPNYNSFGRLLFGLKWKGLDVPRHLHHFNKKSMCLILENNGFTQVSIQTDTFYTSSIKLALGKSLNEKHWSTSKIVNLLLRYWFGRLIGLFGIGDNMIVTARKKERK